MFRVFLTYLLCKTFKYYYFWIILTFSKRKLPIFEPIQSICIRNTYVYEWCLSWSRAWLGPICVLLYNVNSVLFIDVFFWFTFNVKPSFFSGCWMPPMTFLNTEQQKYLLVSTYNLHSRYEEFSMYIPALIWIKIYGPTFNCPL